MHIIPGELFSSVEPFQFNQKIEPHHFAAKLADQADRRLGRPSGRQKIVYDQHPLSRSDGIPMDGQGVRPILKAVLHFKTVSRQFPRFADRHEPGAKPTGEHSPENKTSGFDPHHFLDPTAVIPRGEFFDQAAECSPIFEQCGDIVEEDTGLGKIRHFTDKRLIVDTELRG
jgi:hypothetical protein